MDLDFCQNILVLESSQRELILGKQVLGASQIPGPGRGFEAAEVWKCCWGSWAPFPFQAANPGSGSWLGWIRFLSLPLLLLTMLLNHSFKSLCQRFHLWKFMRSCCFLCRHDFVIAPLQSTVPRVALRSGRVCLHPHGRRWCWRRVAAAELEKSRDGFKWRWRDLWCCCEASRQGKEQGRKPGGICSQRWDLWVPRVIPFVHKCVHMLVIHLRWVCTRTQTSICI